LNLILFETAAERAILPDDDPRTTHVREILRLKVGDAFDVAVANGPRGKATLLENCSEGMSLGFTWEQSVRDDLFPIRLLVGLPRPQTARKILEQAAALGAGAMDFFGTDKGEPSYADSKLWTTDEWKRHLTRGVEQAFCSFIPKVRHWRNLEAVLDDLSQSDGRLALDLYEADAPLSTDAIAGKESVTLAVGPESGWSPRERDLLREAEFTLLHLGERVLRQETACLTALGVLAQPWW